MRTDSECKKIISQIAWEVGVSPALISTRLLSDDDKNDIRAGLIDRGSLRVAVEVWIKNGMPNYSKGLDIPMRYEKMNSL